MSWQILRLEPKKPIRRYLILMEPRGFRYFFIWKYNNIHLTRQERPTAAESIEH